jgi:hypothetical protein
MKIRSSSAIRYDPILRAWSFQGHFLVPATIDVTAIGSRKIIYEEMLLLLKRKLEKPLRMEACLNIEKVLVRYFRGRG